VASVKSPAGAPKGLCAEAFRGDSRSWGPRLRALPGVSSSFPLFSLLCSEIERGSPTVILQLAESRLTQRLFAQIIRRIERLAWHPTW